MTDANDLRRYQRILRWYPYEWRVQHEQVMLGTLLDMDDARGWRGPTLGEAWSLRLDGLRRRLLNAHDGRAQKRHRASPDAESSEQVNVDGIRGDVVAVRGGPQRDSRGTHPNRTSMPTAQAHSEESGAVMTLTPDQTGAAVLPGAAILVSVRRLLMWALLSGIGYSLLLRGSKGACSGGMTSSDAPFEPSTGSAGADASCVHLQLTANPFVFIVLMAIVLVGLIVASRKATTETELHRILNRFAIIAAAFAAFCLIVSQIWFALIPLDGWNGEVTFFTPYLVGDVDISVIRTVA